MRAILTLVVLAAVILAGCSSSPAASSSATPSQTSGTTAAPTSSATGGSPTTAAATTSTTAQNAGNQPPVPSLTATTTGMNATFTLKATDPDGDKLNGTLDFGDGTPASTVTTIPGSLTHAYTKMGNLTATFTVTDGKASAKATAKVVLMAAGAGKEPIVVSGSLPVPEVSYAATETCGVEPGGSGIMWQHPDIPAAAVGGSFTSTPPGMHYEWYNDDSSSDSGAVGGDSGTVPAKTTSAWVCYDDPSMSMVDWTLTIVPK